jgi:hypothetical protein
MRYRSYLPWLLTLLLIFMQQFALLHPYSHSNDWHKNATHQPSNQKDGLPHSETCTQCIAIAGVDSAMASKAFTLQNTTHTFTFYTALLPSLVVIFFQAYLSRAPPPSHS